MLRTSFEFMATKFLVDENVNQKVIRKIPAKEKDFDIVFPEDRTFKGAKDRPVRQLASAEARVLVTCDKDFSQHRLSPPDVPFGVIWLRPKRSGPRLEKLIDRFCRCLQANFSAAPYEFSGRIVEVNESSNEVVVTDSYSSRSYLLPS
jgi:predicted nuclease of predicted toxin-antitoxin system